MKSFITLVMLFASTGFALTKDAVQTSKYKSLNSESFYEMDNNKFVNGVMQLKGDLGKLKVDVRVDAADLKPWAESTCESKCTDIKERDALKCSGVCSIGYPQFLTADEKTQTVFFYQTNGFGHNVPMSIYAMDVVSPKPLAIGTTFAAAIAQASYNAKTGKLTFKEIQHGQTSAQASKTVTVDFKPVH